MTQPPQYAPRYFVKEHCLYESGVNRQGAFTRKLCNLAPAVLREISMDDGVSSAKFVRLGGVHQSGRTLPEITIPAEEVEGLGWIVKYWGMDCILEPGLKTKSSVWNALQTTALNAEKVTVFSTTGWRQIDGDWHFLMPGEDRFTVELPSKMRGYAMERRCEMLDIQTAASLFWQPPAPEEIMLPLLAFTFLSPLNHFLKAAGCEPKFVLFLLGKTGSRKSTLAALMLSFFGRFTASELPLSFRDTANSILYNAFSLKDVLTVIDNLHPSSRMEEQKMNGTAHLCRPQSTTQDLVDGGRYVFPDLVWGKQSVWLSARRVPHPRRGEPGGSPDPLMTYETEELDVRKPKTKPNLDRPADRF